MNRMIIHFFKASILPSSRYSISPVLKIIPVKNSPQQQRPLLSLLYLSLFKAPHRRRMETRRKGNGRHVCLGAVFVQFLASLAVLPRSIWKKRLNSRKAKNWTNSAPQTDATTFDLPSVFILCSPRPSVCPGDPEPWAAGAAGWARQVRLVNCV